MNSKLSKTRSLNVCLTNHFIQMFKKIVAYKTKGFENSFMILMIRNYCA